MTFCWGKMRLTGWQRDSATELQMQGEESGSNGCHYADSWVHMWHLPGEERASVSNHGGVMLCWEPRVPDIHVDVTWTCTTYLNIIAGKCSGIPSGTWQTSRCSHGPQIPRISVWPSIWGVCREKTAQSNEATPPKLKETLLTYRCQLPEDTLSPYKSFHIIQPHESINNTVHTLWSICTLCRTVENVSMMTHDVIKLRSERLTALWRKELWGLIIPAPPPHYSQKPQKTGTVYIWFNIIVQNHLLCSWELQTQLEIQTFKNTYRHMLEDQVWSIRKLSVSSVLKNIK